MLTTDGSGVVRGKLVPREGCRQEGLDPVLQSGCCENEIGRYRPISKS